MPYFLKATSRPSITPGCPRNHTLPRLYSGFTSPRVSPIQDISWSQFLSKTMYHSKLFKNSVKLSLDPVPPLISLGPNTSPTCPWTQYLPKLSCGPEPPQVVPGPNTFPDYPTTNTSPGCPSTQYLPRLSWGPAPPQAVPGPSVSLHYSRI